MATSDTLIKGYRSYSIVATRQEITEPLRYMSIEEQLERENLNVANTASNLRARVLSKLSETNGHSSINGDKPIT